MLFSSILFPAIIQMGVNENLLKNKLNCLLKKPVDTVNINVLTLKILTSNHYIVIESNKTHSIGKQTTVSEY